MLALYCAQTNDYTAYRLTVRRHMQSPVVNQIANQVTLTVIRKKSKEMTVYIIKADVKGRGIQTRCVCGLV